MNDLRDVGLWREEQDDVVERDGADEVEEEPRLDVMLGNLTRLQNDFIGEVVRNDTYNNIDTQVSSLLRHARRRRRRVA